MDTNIKLKLQNGTRSIEVEGILHDVNQILEKWWMIDGGEKIPVSSTSGSTNSNRGKSKKPKGKSAKKSEPSSSSSPTEINEGELINKIKEDDRFNDFEEKILHKSDEFNKVAFVSWYCGDEFLTSGNVMRILNKLGVKITLPNTSSCLSSNSTKFITEKGSHNAVLYKLTSKSRKDFERTVLSNNAD